MYQSKTNISPADLIFAMFGSKDPQTRALSIKFSDSHITDTIHFNKLVKMGLQDPEPIVRSEAFSLMSSFITDDDLSDMIRNETDAALRNAAISYLGENIQQHEKLLLKFLDDKDNDVVLFTTQIISTNPTKALVKKVIKNLTHQDINIAQASVETMVQAREQSVIPVLYYLLSENLWLEMVILDALVKLGDRHVNDLLEERLLSNSEYTALTFEIFMANNSLYYLDMMIRYSGIMLRGPLAETYLTTLAHMLMSEKTNISNSGKPISIFPSAPYSLKPELTITEPSDSIKIALGMLIVAGMLDDLNWNAAEWIVLVRKADHNKNLTELLRKTDWDFIFSKLESEPFSIQTFEYFISINENLVESYLKIHQVRIKIYLHEILRSLTSFSMPLPDFMLGTVEDELLFIPQDLLLNMIPLNKSLLRNYQKLITAFGHNQEIMEQIFNNADSYHPMPELILESMSGYLKSSDSNKRGLAVCGCFKLNGYFPESFLVELLNDPVHDIRIKAYQEAHRNKMFHLIDFIEFPLNTESIELFYFSRWVSDSQFDRHKALLDILHEKAPAPLKEQIKSLSKQHQFQMNGHH